MPQSEDYSFLGYDAYSLVESAKGSAVSMITLPIKLQCHSS